MVRPEKAEAVREIAERFSSTDAALLTEYRGLTVGEMAEVRAALHEADADYKVLKNTLARIAVREVGLDELVGYLEGPVAIAFCHGDAAAAAKALSDVSSRHPVLALKGGVLNGRIIDAAQARELARLEPREVQLAKLATMMNAPAQQLANALSALLRDLASMLAQVTEAKRSAEPAAAEAPAAAEPTADAEPTAVESDQPDARADEPAAATEEPAAQAESPPPEQSTTEESPDDAAGSGDDKEEP